MSSMLIAQGQADDGAAGRVRTALDEPIPVAFEGVPLERLEAYFQNVIGVSVRFDWESLQQYGVDKDTQVRLTLPAVPARTALRISIYAAVAGASERPAALADVPIQIEISNEGVAVTIGPPNEK